MRMVGVCAGPGVAVSFKRVPQAGLLGSPTARVQARTFCWLSSYLLCTTTHFRGSLRPTGTGADRSSWAQEQPCKPSPPVWMPLTPNES